MTANGTKKQTQRKNGVRQQKGSKPRLDHPFGREAPELSVSRLRVVMYTSLLSLDGKKTTEISGEEAEAFGVVFDIGSGFWSYTKEIPLSRHQYRIGHCVRPTGLERSGPMMVYDLDEPQQVKWMKQNVRAFCNGTLDKLAAPGPKNLRTVSTVRDVCNL